MSFAAAPVTPKVKSQNNFNQDPQQVVDWIMTNYDANKDQTLDDSEAQKLWNDVQTFDYAGIVAADVATVKAWIAKFDTNKDGKITAGELYKSLEAETGPLSLASNQTYFNQTEDISSSKNVDSMEKKIEQIAQWIMTNYDTNKDQTLDNSESQKLWNDVQAYDYAGIVAGDVSAVKAWIAKFDTNKDGNITVKELVKALEVEAGPMSLIKFKPKPVKTKPVYTKPVVIKPIVTKPIVFKPKKSFKPLKHYGDNEKFDQSDIQEYAQWILDNYDFDMDGKLDNSEMTQVNIDFPRIFTYGADSNYDYTYSYSEIYAALKRQYNPYTSMIIAKSMINSTIPIGNEMSAEERKLQQYGKWVLSNYDSNKDGQLDENEAQKLWSDIASYDYSGEIMAQVGQVQAWISKFDTDRNGKLTFGELLEALSQIA